MADSYRDRGSLQSEVIIAAWISARSVSCPKTFSIFIKVGSRVTPILKGNYRGSYMATSSRKVLDLAASWQNHGFKLIYVDFNFILKLKVGFVLSYRNSDCVSW